MAKDWTGNGNSIYRTLGASNHTDKEREENDFYATDPIAIEKLAKVFSIKHKVFEPSCGQGHLSKWLLNNGYDVLSSDLIDRSFGYSGVDFFQIKNQNSLFGEYDFDNVLDKWAGYDCFDIVTNPPYNKATEYVQHALDIIPNGGHIILFLKTTFLEGKERKEKIYDINPPRFIYQFSERVVCAKNGEFCDKDGKRISSAVAYAWFIWGKQNVNKETNVYWL